jgi:cell division protein FtsQ
MWSKMLNIAGWAIGSVGMFVLLVAAVSTSHNAVLKNVVVKIDYAGQNYFIDKEEVEETVTDLGYGLDSTRLDDIDPRKIEVILENNAFIEEAQVYKQLNGYLNIDVKIRQPILRVYNRAGNSIYIDNYGVFMPLSRKYSARTPIANGYINMDVTQLVGLNVNDLEEYMDHPQIKLMADLYEVASTCSKNEFWKSQFNQFYVNAQGELELIPRVGDHQVIIGDPSDLDKKLHKLELFYEKGLNKTGWNEYKIINLKYTNQVVCTKS